MPKEAKARIRINKLLEEARDIFPESYAVEDGDVYSVNRERAES